MNATVAIRKPFSIASVPAVAAVLAVFVLGGAGGYAVKSLTASTAAVQPRAATAPAAACPTGTEPAVYYTAGTWHCVDVQRTPRND
jgi:hypothetical protein